MTKRKTSDKQHGKKMADSPEFNDVDDILRYLSQTGHFQLIQFILLAGQYIPVAMEDMMPIFYNLPPMAIRCQDNDTTDDDTDSTNWTAWIKPQDGGFSQDICNCSNGFEYQYQGREYSIVGDMDLVCEKGSLANVATVLFFLGQMVACPICGWVADKYGRRPSLLVWNAMYTITTLGNIFSRDFVSFAILRFLVGFATEGIINTFYILLIEWMPPDKRSVWATILEMAFAFGIIIITAVGYLLQNWIHIQIFLAASSAYSISLYWFAPESLSWLCLQNRIDDVEQSCARVAAFNGIKMSDDVKKSIRRFAQQTATSKGNSTKHHTFLDCFRTPVLRSLTIISCFTWFCSFFGYLGLVYLSIEIASSTYLNLAINGLLEIIPVLCAYGLASRFGNKIPLTMYFFWGGVCAVIAGTIPGVGLAETVGQNIMAFLSRMAYVGTTCVIFVYTCELYPTILRHNAFSLCSLALRTACVLTPLLSLLATESYKGGGFMVVGVLGILAAGATWLLRETRGLPLIHTIADAEAFRKKSSRPSSPVPPPSSVRRASQPRPSITSGSVASPPERGRRISLAVSKLE